MNTWHMLATVYTYPRVIDKAKTLIKIKANNVRTNFTADRRAQKLTREIPVYAQAGTAAALLQNLKTTSFVLLSGYMDVTHNGTLRLMANTFTPLPGRSQIAKDYINELRARDEILSAGDLPVYDLRDAPGEISLSTPDSPDELEW